MDLSLLGRISRRYNVVSAVNSATRKSQHNGRTHRRSTVYLHTADPVADQPLLLLITFCVSRRRRKMYCGHARLCVYVSVRGRIRPHYCMDPDVTWGRGRGCPLVVHYWADLQSGHGLRYYGNITRTLVTIKLASIPRYGAIVRTAGWAGSARAAGRRLAGDGWRSQNCAPYMGSGRGWLAGDWPSTGAFSTLLLQSGLRASTQVPLVAFWQQKANAKC